MDKVIDGTRTKASTAAPPASRNAGGNAAATMQRAYLILYNCVQLLLYVVVLGTSLSFLVAPHKVASTAAAAPGAQEVGLFETASPFLSAAQYLAYMEILHALIGFSGSSVKAACIQVLGRNLVYFGVLMCVPETHTSPFVALLFVSWSVADLVRFPIYVLKLVNFECPQWLNWLRYSAFLILYPSGICAEMGVVVTSLPYIKQNRVNYVSFGDVFTFNFYIFCLCGLASYAYFGPTMYLYMLKQRKRNLNPSSSARDPVQPMKPKTG